MAFCCPRRPQFRLQDGHAGCTRWEPVVPWGTFLVSCIQSTLAKASHAGQD